jgi:hypothetical protein
MERELMVSVTRIAKDEQKARQKADLPARVYLPAKGAKNERPSMTDEVIAERPGIMGGPGIDGQQAEFTLAGNRAYRRKLLFQR